jgi:hypothetical protein
MSARALSLVVVVVVAGGGSATPAGAATTISGSLGGAKLPSTGAGVVSVRAVALETGVIVADARVRSGRFVLRVKSGAYVLLATTTPLRGRAGVDRKVDAIRVATGTSRKLRLSLRRRGNHIKPKPKRKARAAADPGFVSVGYPAAWVQHFAVSGPDEYSVLSKGIADMLITDVGAPVKMRCDGVLVEREHLDVAIAEQKRSQGPAFDPASRIPSGHLIGHNRVVTGTLTVNGATATLTVTVTNTRTGLKRSVTHTGAAGAGIFDLEQSVVDDVAKMICDPPARYVGPVSGSIPAAAGGATGTFSWNGEMTLALEHVGPAPSGSPEGEYAFYRPAAGTVHLTLDLVEGHCTGHGETELSVDPTGGDDSSVQQEVEQPTYTMYAAFGASPGIAFTWSGGTDADPCSDNGTLPFGAGFPALATGTRKAASSTLAGSSADLFPGFMGSVHREWSLVPQD